MRFVYEQARRFVRARPWERLGHASLYLDLKIGSWQEACAQHFTMGSASALFLFPGHQNLSDLQRAGMAEPPAGSIFVELLDDPEPDAVAAVREHGWPVDLRPIPGFQVVTPEGWVALERSETRLLALALAAITDFDGAANNGPDAEVAGELTMPENTRGRYRARRAPDNNDGMVPLMGMPRLDLYGDADCKLSFSTISWPEYWALRARAPDCRSSKVPFEERGEFIPVVTISGSRDQAAEIARKLMAAEPLAVMFGERDDVLAAILVGLKASYMLLEVQEQREQLTLWRHATRSSGGAHALAVEDTDAGQQPADPNTASVHAIFEFLSMAS